ncbi:mechanosensitive ion channel [Mycoplasmatota bacterium]|nr:mechanosensitive ion channel [Mycoplasmatota bacterium]
MDISQILKLNINYNNILIKILQVILILIATMISYYLIGIIIRRIFSLSLKTIRFNRTELIRRRQKTLEKIVLSLWRYFVYFVTFLIILSTIGVNIQTILAGAGILGVVVAVGSQNLMKDFLEGFFNVFEDNISVDDYVVIDNVEGNIIDIGLRTLKIKSFTGEVHIIPNSKIGHIINYSLDDGKALVDILIDYESDLNKTMEVIKKSLLQIKEANTNILSIPLILGVNQLQKLGFEVRIMCQTVRETHWGVQRYIREELLKAFKKEQINIGVNQIKIKGEKIDKNI